jgi:hypothetical protein
LANLRAAFRWAADHGDLDSAAAIAFYASLLGSLVEQFEPGGWAEEILESARDLQHPRLAQLYTMAARYCSVSRFEVGLRYAEAALQAIDSGRFDEVPFMIASELGVLHMINGQPERWIARCRNMISAGSGPSILPRVHMVMTLFMTGALDEALAVSEDLRHADRETQNPALICWALIGYGTTRWEGDPAGALEAHRLGMKIARESGNRLLESYHTGNVARLTAIHGDPREALDLIATSIRSYLDTGNYFLLPQPMAVLAQLFDRIGSYEPAAMLSGFAETSFATSYFQDTVVTITHLREVLGDEAYATLADRGRSMTSSAFAKYAFEQIDKVRSELTSPLGEST